MAVVVVVNVVFTVAPLSMPRKPRASARWLSGPITWTFVMKASRAVRESSISLKAAVSPLLSWVLLLTTFMVVLVTASLLTLMYCCCGERGDCSWGERGDCVCVCGVPPIAAVEVEVAVAAVVAAADPVFTSC